MIKEGHICTQLLLYESIELVLATNGNVIMYISMELVLAINDNVHLGGVSWSKAYFDMLPKVGDIVL